MRWGAREQRVMRLGCCFGRECMCNKRMGQTIVCRRNVGRLVNKDEVGLLVWKVECAVFVVILAGLLHAFLHYY